MSIKLTQTSDDILSSKNVKVYEDITINGISQKSYLKRTNYTYDSKFGASNATIELTNPNGIFSEGGQYEVKQGQEVVILEGMYRTDGQLELYSGFTGIIKEDTKTKSSDNTISLQCYDYISRLQDMDIDYEKSGTKVAVTDEKLIPHYLLLQSGGGNYMHVATSALPRSADYSDQIVTISLSIFRHFCLRFDLLDLRILQIW